MSDVLLSTVNLSNSVKRIGVAAFQDTGLTSMEIPESVMYIGNYAFSLCSKLTSLNVNSNNSYYSSENDVLFNNDKTTIIWCAGGKQGSYTIPESVTQIEKQAFWECTGVNHIHIVGNNKINIEENSFVSSIYQKTILYVPEAQLDYYNKTYPWNKFKLIESNEIKLTDKCNEFNNIEEQGGFTLSYTRSFFNTNWQALYVPFAMSYDDWKDDFEVAYINDVRQYDDNEDGIADRTEVEVFKMKEGKNIEPNTPYLIKAKTTGEKTITLEDATLYQTQENTYDVTSWFTRFNFIGTYHTISNMATKGYYAMAGGALKQATSDAATLQPFRWYLSVTDRNGNPVPLNSKSMSIVFDDGEATGIETINNKAKESTSIHTLTGISKGNDMKSLAPGIYIKNGKKFIVK